MRTRIGLGKSMGQGYKNLTGRDPVVHSMNARGIRSKVYVPKSYPNFRLQYKELEKDYSDKKGFIKEIARNVVDGAKWAVEWEKEHLPAQEQWVIDEFNSAKQKIKQGLDYSNQELSPKQLDALDVHDELDTDDDGTPDLEMEELEDVNEDIKYDLEDIDLNDNDIADAHEDGVFKLHDDEPFKPKEMRETANEKGFSGFQKVGGFIKDKFTQAKEGIESEIKKRELESGYLSTLSDKRLKELAVKEGRGLLGGLNKYESELIDREKNRLRMKYEFQAEKDRLNNELKIEREILNKELKRVREEEKERVKNSGKSLGEILGLK